MDGDVLRWLLAAVCAVIGLRLLRTPLKWGLRLLLHSGAGLLGLMLFNFFGTQLGITLGVNFTNALVVGLLGPAGLAVLLFLRWGVL